MGFLIDSNTLIDYVAEKFKQTQLLQLDAIFDVSMQVSIITKIEVLGYAADPIEETKMIAFLAIAQIFPLSDEIVNQTIILRKNKKI